MIAFHGTDLLYGRVDRVPGLYFVATRFFYLQGVPLVPLENSLILDPARSRRINVQGLGTLVAPDRLGRLPGLIDYHQGVAVGLVWKSVSFAWLRLALFLCTSVCFIWAAVQLIEDATPHHKPAGSIAADAAPLVIGGVFFFLTLLASYRLTWATEARAHKLAAKVGLPVETVQGSFGIEQAQETPSWP